jgi:hypothetical protein
MLELMDLSRSMSAAEDPMTPLILKLLGYLFLLAAIVQVVNAHRWYRVLMVNGLPIYRESIPGLPGLDVVRLHAWLDTQPLYLVGYGVLSKDEVGLLFRWFGGLTGGQGIVRPGPQGLELKIVFAWPALVFYACIAAREALNPRGSDLAFVWVGGFVLFLGAWNILVMRSLVRRMANLPENPPPAHMR